MKTLIQPRRPSLWSVLAASGFAVAGVLMVLRPELGREMPGRELTFSPLIVAAVCLGVLFRTEIGRWMACIGWSLPALDLSFYGIERLAGSRHGDYVEQALTVGITAALGAGLILLDLRKDRRDSRPPAKHLAPRVILGVGSGLVACSGLLNDVFIRSAGSEPAAAAIGLGIVILGPAALGTALVMFALFLLSIE